MIPPEQLQSLKPLPDQVKRMKAVRHQRTIPHNKLHLTKKQRRYAEFPGVGKSGYNGPSNYRSYRI